MINDYLDFQKKATHDKISTVINDSTIYNLVHNDLFYHIDKQNKSAEFQKYYFLVTDNYDNFLKDPEFFKHFKYQYSLQGVDNNLLKKLESKKQVILDYFETNNSFQVYNEFFSKVDSKHGTKTLKKDFGSFFAKLAHTLKPDTFCALDNPIKEYFGFEKESFILAFYIISHSYKNFCSTNQTTIARLKQSFETIDKENIMDHKKITDLKLLDLIFWYRANILTKGSL